MKYINKYKNFSSINESFEEEKRNEFLPDLIDILIDMVEEDFKIILGGVNGKELTLNHYLELNKEEQKDYIHGFNPIYKAGNKIKSEFRIAVKLGEFDYDRLTEIINAMLPVKNRLGDLEWNLVNMEFNFNSKSYKYVIYIFNKPDIKTDDKLPPKEEIRNLFSEIGMMADIDDIEYDGNFCYVGAESTAYDGKIPEDIKSRLDRVLKLLGFDYYEHSVDRDWLTVKFWINPDPTED